MKDFSHLDETGGISMVDVGAKRVTQREAVAVATVRMQPATLRKLIDRALPKGDVLTTAKVAGVLAAKQTPSLIPLCHPLAISSVTVDLEVADDAVEITATVRTTDRTGVEMEALTAVSVAALAVVDMVKGLDKSVRISDVQLEAKSGGRSGDWRRAGDA